MAARGQSGSAIGFAFGGPGGVNAHSVGFLEASRALGIVPDIISCTSGSILWVAEWLAGTPLLPMLEDQIKEDQRIPLPFGWANSLWPSTFGEPATFRPAVWEYWVRWLRPFGSPDSREFINRLFPTHRYVPNQPEGDFVRIAKIIQESKIPVVFNSFHPLTGMGYLHVNAAAQAFLGIPLGEIGGKQKYVPVSVEAVKGALWLYLYGFDEDNPKTLVDGACYRHFIISELHQCDRIYIPRPINTRYFGRLPHNVFENQDFILDQWFNASYAAETASLCRINSLIRSGRVRDPGLRIVDMVEIPVKHQSCQFHKISEDREVFETSFRESHKTLSRHEVPYLEGC